VLRGTFIFCPTCRFVQLLFKLFALTMAETEEPYRTAMEMHVSCCWTVYSMGGSAVRVGVSVGKGVSVGVGVIVTVSVGVGEGVELGSLPVPFKDTYNANAPIMIKSARRPNATGKLKVSCGIRAPWTDLSDFAFGLGVALNSLPHTTQRLAFSAKRVPQVGQSLVGVVSGLIDWGLYHGGWNGKSP